MASKLRIELNVTPDPSRTINSEVGSTDNLNQLLTPDGMTGYRGIHSPTTHAAPAAPSSSPPGGGIDMELPPTYDSVVSDNGVNSPGATSENGSRTISMASRALPFPLVIPQVPNTSPATATTGHSHEFAKVYAPSLSSFNISSDAFATFIDGLNNTVHEAASAAYTSCSSSRRRGRSNSPAEELRVRIRAHLDASNTSTFAPAGLRASIMKGEDMCAVLGVDPGVLQHGPKGPSATEILKPLQGFVLPLSIEGTSNNGQVSEKQSMFDKITNLSINNDPSSPPLSPPPVSSSRSSFERSLSLLSTSTSSSSESESSDSDSDSDSDSEVDDDEVHRSLGHHWKDIQLQRASATATRKHATVNMKADRKISFMQRTRDRWLHKLSTKMAHQESHGRSNDGESRSRMQAAIEQKYEAKVVRVEAKRARAHDAIARWENKRTEWVVGRADWWAARNPAAQQTQNQSTERMQSWGGAGTGSCSSGKDKWKNEWDSEKIRKKAEQDAVKIKWKAEQDAKKWQRKEKQYKEKCDRKDKQAKEKFERKERQYMEKLQRKEKKWARGRHEKDHHHNHQHHDRHGRHGGRHDGHHDGRGHRGHGGGVGGWGWTKGRDGERMEDYWLVVTNSNRAFARQV